MIVLDTRTDTKFRGHIGEAYRMLLNGECDEIITRGADFQCVRVDDPELGARVREKTLASYKNASLRYIVVYNSGDDATRLCLNEDGELTSDFKHGRYFVNREYAECVLKLNMPAYIANGYCEEHFAIEEYLYHNSLRCSLRIYYEIKGLYTDKGLLKFLRKSIEDGLIFPHYDQQGHPYVLVDDLLIFKDQLISFVNGTGIPYKRTFDLRLLLHDGLIAFNAISDFGKANPDVVMPELKYFGHRTDLQNDRKFYDIGEVFYTDPAMQEKLCTYFHLEGWLPDK